MLSLVPIFIDFTSYINNIALFEAQLSASNATIKFQRNNFLKKFKKFTSLIDLGNYTMPELQFLAVMVISVINPVQNHHTYLRRLVTFVME